MSQPYKRISNNVCKHSPLWDMELYSPKDKVGERKNSNFTIEKMAHATLTK